MTKTNEITTSGEGDKLDDKRFTLWPTSIEEIPSVEELQVCGKASLQLMLAKVETALSADAETCRGCADNGSEACLKHCQKHRQSTREVLAAYAQNLQAAWEKAKDLPILPDLRDADWLGDDKSIVAYIVCACINRGKWLIRFTADDTKLTTNEVCFSVDTSLDDPCRQFRCCKDSCNNNTWRKCSKYTFDLYSPYIFTAEEECFFSVHPDELEAWLGACGGLRKEFMMYADVITLLTCEIEARGEGSIRPM